MTESQPLFVYFEDDQKSLEVLEIILYRIMNYSNLEYFSSSENFEDKINNLPKIPDIVFLDIHIEPHNGYEILQWLRGNSTYETTKVIALTASVMVQDVSQLQEAGFDGLIGKPIAHKVFPRLIEQILEGESIWYIP
jgi:CheY-like chemotaxis protein